jgi:hypothetical protein
LFLQQHNNICPALKIQWIDKDRMNNCNTTGSGLNNANYTCAYSGNAVLAGEMHPPHHHKTHDNADEFLPLALPPILDSTTQTYHGRSNFGGRSEEFYSDSTKEKGNLARRSSLVQAFRVVGRVTS